MTAIRLSTTIPALPVLSIPDATAFYASKLGFETVHADPSFASVRRDAAVLHLWAASDETWRARLSVDRVIVSGAESFLVGTHSCRIEVAGLDALFAEYQAAGVLYAPDTRVTAQPWGDRDFPALDLHRNLLTFFERG